MQFDSASQALIELAASRHNAFTTFEAAHINFKLRRLQDCESRGELYRLHPKVWAVTSLPGSDRQVLRAATLARVDSAASLESAAWLHGWIEYPPAQPQLWAGRTRRVRLEGASVSRFDRVDPASDLITVDSIRTLNKATTLCLMGAACPAELLERCVDEYLRAESAQWLHLTLERLYTPKAPGPHALKRILEDTRRVSGIAESVMERITAQLLASADLPPLVLQFPLEVEDRRFRLDLACPVLKLGVEYHSRQHHWGRQKAEADDLRDLLIATLGWEVIYVTHSMVRNPDLLVHHFRQTALTRAQQLGVSLP